MACELEIEGHVATIRTVVREPNLEAFISETDRQLADEIREEVENFLAERFADRIEVSSVSIEPAGSIAVLVALSAIGHYVIEFGALMAGLRELSHLIPLRIRRFVAGIFPVSSEMKPGRLGGIEAPAEVVLGPAVLSAVHPRRRLSKGGRADDWTIALSAAGGAILVIVGVLLGHFL